jgi:hypothetical protein
LQNPSQGDPGDTGSSGVPIRREFPNPQMDCRIVLRIGPKPVYAITNVSR